MTNPHPTLAVAPVVTAMPTAARASLSHKAPVSIGTELRRRWILVAAALLASCIAPTTLAPYTAGVLMPLLQQEFGWTRGMLSLAVSAFGAAVALTAPVAGLVIDRFGTRWALPCSLLLVSACFVALSKMSSNYPVFLGTFMAMGVVGAGASTLVVSRIITSNFDSARGTALGLGLAGIALAGMLSPSVVSHIASSSGWRTAYLAIAVSIAICIPFVAIPVWRAERRTARVSATRSADRAASLGTVLVQPVFWHLGATFLLVQLAVTGLSVHMVPMLLDDGVSPSDAALVAGLIGGVMLIARVAIGWALDCWHPRIVSATVTVACMTGLASLAFGGGGMAVAGAVAAGLMIGAEFDIAAFLVSRYFPTQLFGRAYGLLYTVLALGSMSSVALYGFWFDYARTYTPVLTVATAALGVAAVLFVCLPSPRTAEL